MKLVKPLILLSSLTIIVGCQSKEAATTSTSQASAVSQTNQALKGSNEPSQQIASSSEPVLQQTDLSKAHDINQDLDLAYLTPLFLAQTTRQMSEEEKLGLMSAEYANEADAFKKRDLATKLLPQITQQLDSYKGTYLIKVPIIDQNATKLAFETEQQQKHLSKVATMHFGALRDSDNNPSNGYYNFDTRSFRTFCGIEFLAKNTQNIQFDFGRAPADDTPNPTYNPVPKEGCDLKVEDEAIAKKIEAQIAKNPQYDPDIKRTGEIYYQVSADENYLRAKPLYAKVTYALPDTGEVLIKKEFHW